MKMFMIVDNLVVGLPVPGAINAATYHDHDDGPRENRSSIK